jgi:hypothetical protein
MDLLITTKDIDIEPGSLGQVEIAEGGDLLPTWESDFMKLVVIYPAL